MITQQPHNPQNLTPEQVGVKDGWRLLYEGEGITEGDQYFGSDGWTDSEWEGTVAGAGLDTYRTKQPSPFADGWIKMSEREPTPADFPAIAGSYRDGRWSVSSVFESAMWDRDRTHWVSIPKPPPVPELTQAQKDQAAHTAWYGDHGGTSLDCWTAALAYARSEKERA